MVTWVCVSLEMRRLVSSVVSFFCLLLFVEHFGLRFKELCSLFVPTVLDYFDCCYLVFEPLALPALLETNRGGEGGGGGASCSSSSSRSIFPA